MVAVTADGAPGGTGAPLWMMIPATGRKLMLAWLPPHSGPQFSTKAVVPSAEKTALVGPVKGAGHGENAIHGYILRFTIDRIRRHFLIRLQLVNAINQVAVLHEG